MPGDPRPRRDKFRDRRGLCPLGRHADVDDHRTEAHQGQQAGPVPNRRCGGHDAADHEIRQADRQWQHDPLGEENLDFLESLRTSKIRLILTRHEQAAGFMAATYGRLTGKAGVCLATLGPGATNLVTAAAYAHLGSASAPDFITVDSGDGGTGAAPMALMDNVGIPVKESLPLIVDILTKNGLRERVKVIASGKLVTPAEVAWAFCVGADFVVSARGFMFARGVHLEPDRVHRGAPISRPLAQSGNGSA